MNIERLVGSGGSGKRAVTMREEYKAPNYQLLYDIANTLRIDCVNATNASNSG
jgi:hypothetical protein